MNFGLANDFGNISFEELNSAEVEVVSGGSGGSWGLNNAMLGLGGVGTLATGLGVVVGAMGSSTVIGTGAALGLLVGGPILAAGAGIAIGTALYNYFG